MGQTYGRKLHTSTGLPIRVNIDHNCDWKTGGMTLDWSTVAAASGDTTLDDGLVIVDGKKGMQFGQILCKITASGKYGPYDPTANDGRQLLNTGDCWILSHSWLEEGLGGMPALQATDHPPVFDGGRAWKARIKATAGGPESLAVGPLLSDLQAAMPRLILVSTGG